MLKPGEKGKITKIESTGCFKKRSMNSATCFRESSISCRRPTGNSGGITNYKRGFGQKSA